MGAFDRTKAAVSAVAAVAVVAGCAGAASEAISTPTAPTRMQRRPEKSHPAHASAARRRAASHSVRWTRRPPVGSAWRERVRRELVRTTETTSGRDTPRTETSRRVLSFDANVEVLAASPTREQARYTIASFTRVEGTRSHDLLRSGTVIEIAREIGRGWVTRAGRALDRRVVAELAEVVEIGLPPRGYDYDAMFGTRASRRPGERWPADVRAVSRLIAQPVEHVNASATLRELRAIDGVACLVLQYGVVVTDRVVPGVGPGAEIESASLQMQGELALPVDPSLPALRTSMLRNEAHVAVSSAPPRRVAVTSAAHTTKLRTIRPRTAGVPVGVAAR